MGFEIGCIRVFRLAAWNSPLRASMNPLVFGRSGPGDDGLSKWVRIMGRPVAIPRNLRPL